MLTSCECGGQAIGSYMNVTETSVTTIEDFYSVMSDEFDHQSVREIICSTEFLKEDFFKINQKFKKVKWQYFGSQNGVWRSYPAKKQCNQQNPTNKPFYISATTGFKNIVLIMDFSQSMNFNNKILHFKNILKEVITSLGFFDWIGIVSFSNGSATCYNGKMLRATLENKEKIKNYIDMLDAKGLSSYKKAFIQAFNLMKNFTGDDIGRKACRTHFMFFSDGNPTAGESTLEGLKEIIENLKIKIEINVKISTFNIMKPSAEYLLYHISCIGRGFYYFIPSLSDFKKYVFKFFMDITMEITQKGPIWVEPYKDGWGLGWITTMTYPIYDTHSTLLGVLALDFKLDNFNINKKNTSDILKYLSGRNEKINLDCEEYEDDECKLNFIRKKPCSLQIQCNYNYNSIYNNTCKQFKFKPFFKGEKLGNYSECCQECILSKDDTAYLTYIYISLAFMILISIVGIIIYFKKRRKLKSQKSSWVD